MKMIRKGTLRWNCGQSLVEFTFCVPFLLLLLCVTIDMGMVLYHSMRFQDAAREAARAGAQRKTDAQILGQIQSDLPGYGLSASNVTISILGTSGTALPVNDRTPGARLEVLITKNVSYCTPLDTFFNWVNPLTVRSFASFRVERST